ncbi:D-alanine--D-alanine ligase [Glaciecola sp. MH2013]|uniref:D-alanine--D-alanine ligase n=1 Tax=Glaciecola sp. MH2013 TaxID=2785524 RepID=UPI00189C849C|nr:D-alanine--D-alanine ligase [Glaciecola sp. MH2013]MBF7072046.1 D-alanine--D-alanine ligase [Glaciecola sp. MH2013]
MSLDEIRKIGPNRFGKVAVLLGGKSAEREVSLASGKAVLDGLIANGIDAHAFDTKERALSDLKDKGFERAFIILHGRGGEDGSMQGALETLGIPYTGSKVLGSALAMDKVCSKQIWSNLGLPTAQYKVVTKALVSNFSATDFDSLLNDLSGQAMVKPAREGSSIGMAKVSSGTELRSAIVNALMYDDEILIESYITGPEFTVSILGNQALPSIRMSTPHVFYDYDAKYIDNTTNYYCPSGLSEKEEAELSALCVKAFTALKGEGWGRIDLMQEESGKFLLLESNTVPGMTKTSLVPKSAKQAGLSFEDLVTIILASSLER